MPVSVSVPAFGCQSPFPFPFPRSDTPMCRRLLIQTAETAENAEHRQVTSSAMASAASAASAVPFGWEGRA